MDKFVDLHNHSTYSFLDAYGTPEQIVDKACSLGREAIALTDHGNVSGLCMLEKACIKNNIKPIYGCEFYCSDADKTRERYHLTVLSKNLNGYKNLSKLVGSAWENFYYFPILKTPDLIKYKEDLIIFSGCLESKLSKLILSDDITSADKLVKKFKSIFEDFYIEIQPFDLVESIKVNKVAFKLAQNNNVKMVLTNDVHYPDVKYQDVRRILRAIRFRKKYAEIDADTQDMSILTYKALYDKMYNIYGNDKIWKSSLDNTIEIADLCEEYTIPKAKLFRFDIPNKKEYFREMCYNGLKNRGFLGNKVYIDRLEYELNIIEEKNYLDYFIVVNDLVNWAKDNNIFVGPARGSSGGSLICYVLNITEVDPIKFELLFERFLDITRTDYPDIDIDFTDEDRSKIFEYLIGKYGKNKVAHIGTFAKFKGRNSLDEVGKAFEVPPDKVDIIKRLLIDRSIADSRASFCIQDTMDKFSQAHNVSIEYPDINNAKLLEGQYRHMGIHAAGMIISKEPLEDSMALYTRNDTVIASLDKDDIEYLGFLKFDLLGLKTLNLLKKICSRVGLTYKDLTKISMEDEKTIEGFKKSDIVGIFQYEGRTASSLIGHIKPDCFDMIRDINALIRPGPLYSRDTSNYILVRNDPKVLEDQFEDEVDVIKDITKETYGQILYQEQVMQVVRNIASFSWADTAKIRHAMSKSLGDEFMFGFKEKFVNGAMENGYDENYAEKIWERINSHGSWSFCKSHAVGYAILAFWTMYMKQHFPLEFYWASLSLEDKDFNKSRLMLDLIGKGYKVLPPRINYSRESWEIEGNAIRSGLLEIKGIGEKVAQHIVKHYPYKDLDDMKAKLSKRLFNSKIVGLVQNSPLFDKKSSNMEFTVFKDLDILNSVDTTHRIKQIDYFADEKTRIKEEIVIACFIKEKMLYNIYEEDKIRERTIKYKDPEIADYMVVTMSDFTDVIKGRLSRYIYKDHRDLLWDLKDTDPVKITCKSRSNSRVVDVLKIERIEQNA